MIEIRVPRQVVPDFARPLDREPQMFDRIGLSAREALAAREVVKQRRILGMRLDHVPSPVGRFCVASLPVERADWCPELPALRLVYLPGGCPHREDRCSGLLRERRPPQTRTDEYERSSGRIHAVALEFEPGPPALDE